VAPALRTLIISDLHLGNWARHDVLRRAGPRGRLLDALGGVDRLVLLGDVAELVTRNRRRALGVAEPVLREIGHRLGAGREAILVPGNHDAPLVRGWARDQGDRLTLDTVVPPDASPALARVVSWLSPARVQVRYPGVWLADRVWATHGHYLDRHLMPESAFGILRGEQSARGRAVARPSDYERARSRSRRAREPFLTRLLNRPVATLIESASELVRVTALPALPRLLMNARLTSLTAAAIDFQMRHAGIPAMARAARQLGVDADWIIFGHVHRFGPLNRESVWPAPRDGPRFLNTGSWLYEPLLVDRARPPHPYWPGGAVLLAADRDPRAVGLLDGLSADELRGARAATGPTKPRG